MWDLIVSVPDHCLSLHFDLHLIGPGAVARSEACSLGIQAAPSSIPTSPRPAHSFWRLGHENISTAILPLPLIQEEQLSVTGERMCTKYW